MARRKILKEYLHSTNKGEIPETEKDVFKKIFSTYYTTDEGQVKLAEEEIEKVRIGEDPEWKKRCFEIYCNGDWWPASIKKLAGSTTSWKANRTRAMRNAIQPQIVAFKTENPLDPNANCPVVKESKLGVDAEVDHSPPNTFSKLANDWLKNNSNCDKKSFEYDNTIRAHVLNEPYKSQWMTYHQTNVQLRWASKEGNRQQTQLFGQGK